jgi:hypothetical protein
MKIIKKYFLFIRLIAKLFIAFFMVVGALLIINLLYSPPLPLTYNYNKGENAAWVRHQWFSDEHTDADIHEFVDKLKNMEITSIYVHIGPMDNKGAIPEFDKSIWDFNRDRIRESYPELQILAWIGGVTQKKFGVASDTLDMCNPELMETIAGLSAETMAECQFDGIHYNIEPLPDDQKNFLLLLELTRNKIGDKKLSVSSHRIVFSDIISRSLKHISRDTLGVWGPTYYREVAERCDEIAVMAYDSVSQTPASYRRFMIRQVKNITRAIRGTGCELLVGVPTYEEVTFSHKPDVENIAHALEGTIIGLESIPHKDIVRGVSIYALWTTNEKDMEIYRKLWLRED